MADKTYGEKNSHTQNVFGTPVQEMSADDGYEISEDNGVESP